MSIAIDVGQRNSPAGFTEPCKARLALKTSVAIAKEDSRQSKIIHDNNILAAVLVDIALCDRDGQNDEAIEQRQTTLELPGPRVAINKRAPVRIHQRDIGLAVFLKITGH